MSMLDDELWDKAFILEKSLMCRNISIHIDHFEIKLMDCYLDDLEKIILKAIRFYKDNKEMPKVPINN